MRERLLLRQFIDYPSTYSLARFSQCWRAPMKTSSALSGMLLGVLFSCAMPCQGDSYAVPSNARFTSTAPFSHGFQRIANTPKRSSKPSPAFRKKLKQPLKINKVNQKRYSRDIERIAKQHQMEPALIHAVISAESGYNPRAVSPKGAMGLMQLMPETAKRFGVHNPFDPIANIDGGTRYLRWLLKRFKNIKLALAAYNAGERVVDRYGHNVPYEETRIYVFRVINFYLYYRFMPG